MIFFPAIDLKDGECVRLIRGNMNESTVFDSEPQKRAAKFAEAGCSWLHIVDLNGAFEGKPKNSKPIKEILSNVDINIQLGGGIRNIETIDYWLDLGVQRIILGTIALKQPAIVEQACKKYPKQIAVGLDSREGKVAVEGWAEQSNIKAIDLARKFEDAGVAAIIYTDINRDGVLLGPAIEETIKFADEIIVILDNCTDSSIKIVKKYTKSYYNGKCG